MSNNRNGAFIKVKKNTRVLESYKDSPLVFIMKNKSTDEISYAETYVGTLDCVEGEKIYLKDAYEIHDDKSIHIENEFKKWDLTREDPTIKEFPHIKLEFVDSVYASKLNLTLEQVWNVWSDPRDLFKTQTYQKIQDTFSRIQKTFTDKSEPVFLNQVGERLSLKKICEIESVEGKPITMIAVTRHQYDISNFSKYENYIKNELNHSRFYYGLWPDLEKEKSEWDVLYAIPTDDPEQIQNHLNAHNHMNQGIAQVMALIIDSNGKYKVLKNSTCL